MHDIMSELRRVLSDNLPFAAECFHESTQKVVAAAKAEVDAFVTGVVVRTGLETLRSEGKMLPASMDADAPPDVPKLPGKE